MPTHDETRKTDDLRPSEAMRAATHASRAASESTADAAGRKRQGSAGPNPATM
jgi:hypothetical protein